MTSALSALHRQLFGLQLSQLLQKKSLFTLPVSGPVPGVATHEYPTPDDNPLRHASKFLVLKYRVHNLTSSRREYPFQ